MSALNRLSKTQKQQLNDALDSIATGYLKGTGVKLEMEAQFNRPSGSGDPQCDSCEGSGYSYCEYCDEGQREHEHCDCTENCDTDYEDCGECDGEWRWTCNSCDGEGEPEEGAPDWGDPLVCQQFIVDNVPKSARNAIKFIKFYRDGSVDSECTVTLPIHQAHLLVHFLEAWTKLGKAIGNGIEIHRAGMHISILNDPNCFYTPGLDLNILNPRYVNNFADAMTPLLPALYFLASPSQQSRGLSYRTPRIHPDKGGVYPAICTHGNSTFEYRVFETCYDRPLMLVDFLIVIAKTLQFYKPEPTETHMKLGKLGIKDGNGLDRFYFTPKHLIALDKGLKWLKPDYKTIDQLKAERDFKVDRKYLSDEHKKRCDAWKEDFARVKASNKSRRKSLYYEGLMRAYRRQSEGYADVTDVKQYAKNFLDGYLREYNLSTNARAYLKNQADRFANDCAYSIENV